MTPWTILGQMTCGAFILATNRRIAPKYPLVATTEVVCGAYVATETCEDACP